MIRGALCAAILACSALSAGCICADILIHSVVVEIRDARGEPLVPDEVSYTVDGSAPIEVCHLDCRSDFAVGTTGGRHVVTARFDGLEASEERTVEHDGCHPLTEEMTLTLGR